MLVTSILPFSHNVSTLPKAIFNFSVTFILSFTNAVNLYQSKILSFGKELMTFSTLQVSGVGLKFGLLT